MYKKTHGSVYYLIVLHTENYIKIGSAIYKLVRIVKYQNSHHSSFIHSMHKKQYLTSDTNLCTKLYFIQSITNNMGYSC